MKKKSGGRARTASTTNGRQEIDALHTRWIAAIGRGDVDAVMAMLDDDYVLLAPNAPPQTKADLRPLLTASLAKQRRASLSFECDALVVNGRLAVERGWDVQTMEQADGAIPKSQRQRVTLVLRRKDDGHWVFLWGMSQPGPPAP